VDAAGQFLVDLQDLPDLAVLPVGGLCAGVFQWRSCSLLILLDGDRAQEPKVPGSPLLIQCARSYWPSR
jgi:hypothetical protein